MTDPVSLGEIPYEDDPQYFRVACASCGATRSSRWKECFCHETRTKKYLGSADLGADDGSVESRRDNP